MHSDEFTVRSASWRTDHKVLTAIRYQVFVVEQQVPLALELDAHDASCHHVLAALPDGTGIGTGRLLDDGHIGRMAVLAAYRRQGVGSAMLAALVQEAIARGLPEVALNAQQSAIGFYQRHGFRVVSDAFMDAGIAHRKMVLRGA